ncbi:PREDICTED: pre-mRNA-splicing factor CWC25 homolog [Acropora digitifera]|uniref:pre-mRNA-splicing factor CWC25 homolog n=1 Tax=Acropora digitifera TaxID=70779 RepID=UPI00077A2309|nr:PREDICTED: pre-mRNA-splicing factor CWC25 homolog [Acropora digitifera]
MGGGDLNLKKSWHPQTLRNVERVWKAEQKADAESKKIEQLRKELEEERAREEMQKHAIDQGIAKKKGEYYFCLMIAFASLSGFTLHHSSNYDGRFDFFYFATVVSWLLVIALFLIFALTLTDRLYEKCGNINWNLLLAIYSPVTAFLLLISSALVLDVAVLLRRSEEIVGGQIQQNCNLLPCGNIEAAGVSLIVHLLLLFKCYAAVSFCPSTFTLQDTLVAGASFMNDTGANTPNDLAAKVRDDPLFLIKRKEEEKRKELLNNPVKMKQLKMMLQANLEKSSKKKKEKKKKEKKEKRREGIRIRGKERDYHESERSEDEFRDGRNGHKKHRRDRNRREESHVETTGKSERERKNRRNEELEDDVREGLKEERRKDKERPRQRNDEPNGERDHRRRWKEEVEMRNGNCIDYQDSKRSPDRKRTQKRSRSRSPVPRRDWERREKPNRNHLLLTEKKKWQNGGSSITKHMDAAEKEKRLAAMMDNAAWRDEQRGKNVKRYEEEDARLEAKEAKDTDKSAAFLHDIKIQSFSSKTTSSVSDRIRRNINSVQRTPAALDSFLGK